ncbi:MAG: hypothetical protein V9G19_04695 [Tetrasphaera sp.]
MKPAPRASWDDHQANDQLDQNEAAQLETVRARAKNWLGILSALTGLLATALVLNGPDKVSDLGTGGAAAVALLLGFGGLLLAGGTYFAYRAAYGSDKALEAVNRQPLSGLATRVRAAGAAAADRAFKDLRTALAATFLGLVFIACGTIATWFVAAPAEPEAPASTCISFSGKVVAEIDAGSVAVSRLARGARVAPCPK